MLIILILVLNVLISWFNAWSCGRAWPETKQQGGLAHFMNWMGAIMAACGFTWVILIGLGYIGTKIPYQQATAEHPTIYLLSAERYLVALELGYVAIIVPVLGSGLALTLNSWAYFWRRRSFGSGAAAAYNTYAMFHNTYHAVQLLPGIFRHLGGVFGGSGSSKSSSSNDGKGFLLVIVVGLVIASIIGGILLTRAILLASARKAVENRMREYSPTTF